MPLLVAWLLACSPPDGEAGPDSAAPLVEAPPCTPVEAVFFDLGGTLLAERDDGLFEDVLGAGQLLDALLEGGLPVGLVTNVPRGWTRADLEALLVDPSLLDRFDVVLLSSEAEARPKPDPDIFTEAVALLPEPPPIAQILFVTEELDHLADEEEPTRGARAAGMVGVHLSDDAPSPLADRTVTTAGFASMASEPWVACLEAESVVEAGR